MDENARIAWDRRFIETPGKWRDPEPFLVLAYERFVAPAFPNGGGALDIAGGMGRHALYLAERGWRVTLVDISGIGVEQARRTAEQRSLSLTAVQIDVTEMRLEKQAFDLIIVFNFLERSLLPHISDAVKPGGLLIYKTYTVEQLKLGTGGPSDPARLWQPGELRMAFPDFEVLHYRESIAEKAIAELVARKS